MDNKEESLEDRIIDFLVFAANTIALLINIACASYSLSRRG